MGTDLQEEDIDMSYVVKKHEGYVKAQYLDDEGNPGRAIVGWSGGNIQGLIFAKHDGNDADDNPNFKYLLIVDNDGDGWKYQRLINLSPTKAKKLRGALIGEPVGEGIILSVLERSLRELEGYA